MLFRSRVFLEQLLRQLAQSQQLSYTLLLRGFAAALARLPQPLNLHSALPVLVGELIAREFGSVGGEAAAAGGAAAEFGAPEARMAERLATERPMAGSGAPGPVGSAPVQPDPEGADPGAADLLSPEPSALIGQIAPASADAVPTAARIAGRTAASEHTSSALAIPLGLWQAFLREGQAAQLGPRLHDAVLADPEGFVALLRQLLSAAPPGRASGAVLAPDAAEPAAERQGTEQPGATSATAASATAGSAWLERLLRWLLPESLALLVATAAGDPHPAARG